MVTRYDVTRDSLCGLNGASIYDSHHYLDMVLSRMSDLSEFYPGFHNWMAEKVIPGLFDNQRSLHLYFSSVNQQLAGITILKHSQEEQKLCCLRVLPNNLKLKQCINNFWIEEDGFLQFSASTVKTYRRCSTGEWQTF